MSHFVFFLKIWHHLYPSYDTPLLGRLFSLFYWGTFSGLRALLLGACIGSSAALLVWLGSILLDGHANLVIVHVNFTLRYFDLRRHLLAQILRDTLLEVGFLGDSALGYVESRGAFALLKL